MNRLSDDTVSQLPAEVAVPGYDRTRLRTGIVHLGVGAFHRAHQAMYLDRLMNEGMAEDWAVCGVGILPVDRPLAEALTAQDGLYTLTEKDNDGSQQRRVVGAMREYLFAPDDPEAVVEKLADPGTRVVTLTITEGGYNLDPGTGEFDLSEPGVAADLDRDEGWTTVFGLVVAALARRRERGTPAFTVVCCDNIENNGDVARTAFCTYAEAREEALGAWVREQVRFPSSMVDRITPATTPADREAVSADLGVVDGAPVACEPFTQWVLEDDFTQGRPPLESAGVQLVHDVRPYELMKLRLLNASHQAICYFAHLSGYEYVHEAALDPVLRDFVRAYMQREGRPTLDEVPGIDLDEYVDTLLHRFANPALGDTVARLCALTSDRIPTWLLPVVRLNLASGGEVERSAAVVASWARYAQGTDEQGGEITVVDRLAPVLVEAARRGPEAFLGLREVFGDLAEDERFRRAYLWTSQSLHAEGAQATLAAMAVPDLRALMSS